MNCLTQSKFTSPLSFQFWLLSLSTMPCRSCFNVSDFCISLDVKSILSTSCLPIIFLNVGNIACFFFSYLSAPSLGTMSILLKRILTSLWSEYSCCFHIVKQVLVILKHLQIVCSQQHRNIYEEKNPVCILY